MTAHETGSYAVEGLENHIGATFYHDVAGTYHMDSWNTDFTFGIRNLLDTDPPVAMSAFANSFLPTVYRTPGRFFYARVGVKFWAKPGTLEKSRELSDPGNGAALLDIYV